MEYPKKYVLHKQGRVCRHLWFMTKGAIRFFYITDEGRELNTWFSLDQQIVTDAPGLVSQTVSRETIQLIEDSELYAIEYSALAIDHNDKLFNNFLNEGQLSYRLKDWLGISVGGSFDGEVIMPTLGLNLSYLNKKGDFLSKPIQPLELQNELPPVFSD